MSMTSKQVGVYARKVSKKLSTEDFTLWFKFTHADGSSMSFDNCLYEQIDENPELPKSRAWIVIWTKNHGAFIYPEDELTDWDGGEQSDLENPATYLVLPV